MTETKKIKILVLTPTLQCGGSEKFVSLMCNYINTKIFTVCLVVINNANPFYRITNAAINVIDLQKTRVLFSLPAIKKAVKQFQPHIIFSTANHLNLYLAIFKHHFKPGLQFIAREASIVSISSQHAKMPPLYNLLTKKYYNRFNRIICQSKYMQQDLVKHYHINADKTIVIHNAVQEITALPVRHKKQDRIFKFITVARLSEEKGIERLIHAVGLLSVPYQYFIIGDGNKKNTLQQLIKELQLQDNIFLLGEKNEPFSDMEDADLLLMGSYYEGFPNVLLEAGAHGIPAVVFGAPGGIPEIIIENENGLLVEDNDLVGFASAINKALALPFNSNTIIEATQKRFSIKRMVSGLEKLFLSLTVNK